MEKLNPREAKANSSWTSRTLAPYLLLILGLLFTFLVSYYLRPFLPYIFVVGVLFSLSLFSIVGSQMRARSAAERATSEVRDSEATIRKTLAERELAEEALRESEELYRELVENANDIVFTLDFEGQITSINKAAEVTTEYSQNELLTMKIGQILSAESASAGERMLSNKMSGQRRTIYEVEIVSKTGRILTLEISSRLVYRSGEPVGIQGIARDISTRRRAEEALREADQRALFEYERLLERISGLAQALGTARDLTTIYRGLREFTKVSIPCNGFFVSLYDPIRDVRTACYGWGDDKEIDISALPPMPVTTSGPNSRAVRTGQVVIEISREKVTSHRRSSCHCRVGRGGMPGRVGNGIVDFSLNPMMIFATLVRLESNFSFLRSLPNCRLLTGRSPACSA